MDLPSFDPKLLPPIAYASPEGVSPPDPAAFTPATNLVDLNRPKDGLWTSPVTAWDDDGTPASTAWTDWCAAPDQTGLPHLHHVTGTPYTRVVTVEPLPRARIYRIDTAQDLDRLVAAFQLPEGMPMRATAPDWGSSPLSPPCTAGRHPACCGCARPTGSPVSSRTPGRRSAGTLRPAR